MPKKADPVVKPKDEKKTYPVPAEVTSIERECGLPPIRGTAEIDWSQFSFPATALSDYQSDGVSIDEVMNNKERYRFRAAVVSAFEMIRKKWQPGAGTTKFRTTVVAPISDKQRIEIKNELEYWAVSEIELDAVVDELNAVNDMKKNEPKRWQAHYDYALAAAMARRAYMNEYNKLMGNLITDTLPALNLGQDGYALVASATFKSGKASVMMAEDSQRQFQQIALTHKNTPWAVFAARDAAIPLGSDWVPAAVK